MFEHFSPALNICQRCFLGRLNVFPLKGTYRFFPIRAPIFPATRKLIIRQFSSKSANVPFAKVQPKRATYRLIYHNVEHHHYSYYQAMAIIVSFIIGSRAIYMLFLSPEERSVLSKGRLDQWAPRTIDKIFIWSYLGISGVIVIAMSTALRKWMVIKLYENVAENGKYVAILKDYFHRDYRLFFSLEDVKLPQVDALHFYRILASLVVRNESNGKFQYFSVSPKYFDVPASLERLTKGEGNFKTQQEMYQKLEKFPETKMKKEIWSQIFHPPKEEFAEFEEKNEKTQEIKEKN